MVFFHIGHAPCQPLREVAPLLAGRCRLRMFGLLGMVLGRHPVRNRLRKDCQRARQEHREQQPGKPKTAPGMQPGLGLAKAGLSGT